MPDSTARYHMVPRASDDSDRESSPHEQLLPSSNISSRYHGLGTWSIELHPVIFFRIVSTIFAITAFILLVIDGEGPFVASDIFLMTL